MDHGEWAGDPFDGPPARAAMLADRTRASR